MDRVRARGAAQVRTRQAWQVSSKYGTERPILATLITPLDATRASSKVQSHDHWNNAKVHGHYDTLIFANKIGSPRGRKFTKRKRIFCDFFLPHNNTPPFDTSRCNHQARLHTCWPNDCKICHPNAFSHTLASGVSQTGARCVYEFSQYAIRID
jgi:hypothetical protein